MRALFVVVGLLFAWYARHVLLLAFAGVLFAVFLARLADQVRRWTGLPRSLSFALVVLLLVGLFVSAFWLRGSEIAAQARELAGQLPGAFDAVREWITNAGGGLELPPAKELASRGLDALASAAGWLGGAIGGLASVGLIAFFAIALGIAPEPYLDGALALVPRERRARLRALAEKVSDTLWWWLLGRLASMTFIGVTSWIGLALLGVPLAFVLGLLAGLLSFVPNVGPILSALPAILIAWVQSPQQALAVCGLYVGLQLVDNYALGPFIDRKTVYMPPALTVFAQLCFALFGGVLGAAVATPLVAAGIVAVKDLWLDAGDRSRTCTPCGNGF